MNHQPLGGAGTSPRLSVKLLVVAGGVLAGLLIFELALRLAGYTYPVFYAPDAARGWSLRPGVEGWYRKEGEAYIRVNSDGLRDREHARPKPPDTLRVAVLGDSYAEALQVEQEKAFWSVMEARLQGCGGFGGKKVEVINFGVSGYGTAQELLTLREKVWDYSPDVVLLAVTTNNDLIDNSRALKGTDEIPYFAFRDGQLVPDDSFRDNPAFRWRQSALSRAGRWLRENLRFVQSVHQSHGALKSALDAYRDRRADVTREGARSNSAAAAASPDKDIPATAEQPPQQKEARPAPLDEPGVANAVYREPSDAAADAVWKESWQVTEALIALLHDEVERHGVKFMAVTLSNPIQVHPDASARAAFMRRIGVEDLFYPDRRFRALGQREGFKVFNLAPAFQLYADQHKVFLHGFGHEMGNGHWNETGHALAGDLIAPELCRVASD
ncbi:MAG: SGNH/GDSL hydrolase family protein [Acidobacteria bacterium]|nr:SGNH/GDSL hydrolase family protein [Acidobacteriota bacterium]